ncbi:GNAT family N-acetyltransferase [Halalkalibacter krulwichiae]|uniref:Putative ribosomal N-acetyltransferase YdaF n=1 Tax=Halalkalibacter krulwichiae TaxID=199441 RepID=A0A1X9M843_9BACI|nr:GNAT family protein [Halalkalibacter krulwichiae]ARK29615.1 Putative ribosomal N-acetyltransferase YdaF [Halalkalibacter krulwichiae]
MFIHKIDDELSLKLIDIRDSERIFHLTEQSRAYLRQWLPWLDQTTELEHTKGFIKGCVTAFAEEKSMNTVILYNDEAVGIAGYNVLDWNNKVGHIGYWLAKDFQGNGIMTRVAKALTDYAFDELRLNKVEIRAAVNNQRSRSIPERLGYVKEGEIRQAEWLYDHYVDHVIYGVLVSEWKEERNNLKKR